MTQDNGNLCNSPEIINQLNTNRLNIFSIVVENSRRLLQHYEISKYEIDIQAGAAGTERRIARINDHDNFNESISARNLRYGELTAVYWIWKNCTSEYVGTCHYRRKFIITDEELDTYMDAGIDAILRNRQHLNMGMKAQYIKYSYRYDWEAMLDIINKKNPEFYNYIIENQDIADWRTCCIGIYKKKVFDDMCSFIFPFLFEFEK